MRAPTRFKFIGQGDAASLGGRVQDINPHGGIIGPWRRWRGDPGVTDNIEFPGHPANYIATGDLPDAVNTSIALGKPLLLTGNPGTGKSQLAERIAWEFNLGPVLRFEAQSLSEANDLFYRFDLVGHLAAVEILKASGASGAAANTEGHAISSPMRFLKLGPLGEAIVRSAPNEETKRQLFDAAFAPAESAGIAEARPSVVLIDEIDKASRDFPNDLLNGIERLEFGIRELGIASVAVDPHYRPLVIITSNSERDLPAPFLRRCTFHHIEDPSRQELERIIAQRFFAPGSSAHGTPELPEFYRQLLGHYLAFREKHDGTLRYTPGTSELIDWTQALIYTSGSQAPTISGPHSIRLKKPRARWPRIPAMRPSLGNS